MKIRSLVAGSRTGRFVILLVIIAMIFSNTTVFVQAAGSPSAADSATTLLTLLGVISTDSTGSYNLERFVTRAEFAKMLVMASPFKNLVATSSYSSPFRDVAAKDWAAPYIRIAASKGLLSGYSDGNFRPDSVITLEQGINSVLKLLGYMQSDFSGAFPYAQMNIYSSSGLSNNIVGGVGTLMTRGDTANLIYNLMGTTTKDGNQKYAETLGYSLNSNGEVDYAGVINENMNGPYTVRSTDWARDLGMQISNLTLYKNGSVITSSDVENYDILYYSQSKDTVWVYDDRVIGVYEKASPSQNVVNSVTISGKEYHIESSAAFTALSSMGTLEIGSAVTLLLGKNGGVADAISNSVLNETVSLYITEKGTKTYVNANGNQYTSQYIKGINTKGTEMEYAVGANSIDIGDMVNISFDEDGVMRIGTVSRNWSLSGKVDAILNRIGTTAIAANATIWDTSLGNYTITSLSRLNGVTINSNQVRYYEASNGKITALILDDVTGDTMKYGVVTSVRSNTSSNNPSGSYDYLVDGIGGTLSTQNSILAIDPGPARFYGEGGSIKSIRNLTKIGSRASSFTSTQMIVNDNVGTYPISPGVSVYINASGTYRISNLSEALSAYHSGKSVSFYYDKEPSRGGQIRVITYFE